MLNLDITIGTIFVLCVYMWYLSQKPHSGFQLTANWRRSRYKICIVFRKPDKRSVRKIMFCQHVHITQIWHKCSFSFHHPTTKFKRRHTPFIARLKWFIVFSPKTITRWMTNNYMKMYMKKIEKKCTWKLLGIISKKIQHYIIV